VHIDVLSISYGWPEPLWTAAALDVGEEKRDVARWRGDAHERDPAQLGIGARFE